MDGVDESRALATVARRVGRDLSGAAKVSKLSIGVVTDLRSWQQLGGLQCRMYRRDESPGPRPRLLDPRAHVELWTRLWWVYC